MKSYAKRSVDALPLNPFVANVINGLMTLE